MSEAKRTEEIKALALELGFAAVGITLPEPPQHLSVYLNWLEQGYQGEMTYMAEQRAVFLRSNPQELLPACRSVIVLAARYPAATPPRTERDDISPDADRRAGGKIPYGRVAAYAWGDDYHTVLRQRMEHLMQRIQEKVDRPIGYRCFTDSAPILERELAQRAGLGWIGKNTCLIHPRLGSYLFLAEIFSDLELTPDKPFLADRCGTCQRCIQACPTHCILPDRTLDARRCISYLTIEHRSAIALELRPALGDWVFGCDICQQVCPWNRRVSSQPSFAEFLPHPERVWLPLSELLAMTPTEFKQKFRHSPLFRAKWRGLVRNSALVLGNLARMQRLPPHTALSLLNTAYQRHSEPMLRQQVAWALAQIASPAAQQALREHLSRETDAQTKAEIEALLAQSKPH